MNLINAMISRIFSRFIQDDTLLGVASPIDVQKVNLSNIIRLGESWLEKLINFSIRVVICIIVFFIARKLIDIAIKMLDKIFKKREIEGAAITLLHSVITALLYIILFVVLAMILGFKSVSFAALLASMGLAVGMALSGQLQNLAGGVIIVFTKPFKIGDFIEAQGVSGEVSAVTLFHTHVISPDNKILFLPNGALSSNVIINYSQQKTRRLSWTIGIEYNSDFDYAKSVILDILSKDERIIKTIEPIVVLGTLNSSSVDIVVRVWVNVADYWNVYWDFNRNVYIKFNELGIGFPFPQLTVHQAKD